MSSNHQSIFSPRYFALSIGIILSVMAVGFEGLSVTTIAPSIAGDLNGLSLFGWIFSTYLLAQIIGTLVVGRIIDKKRPCCTIHFCAAVVYRRTGRCCNSRQYVYHDWITGSARFGCRSYDDLCIYGYFLKLPG